MHTSLALFLVTSPFSFNLYLNTHFVPIKFLSLGLGTRVQVLFFYICSIYSFIASIQLSFSRESFSATGSILLRKHVHFSLFLVNMSSVWCPIICSGAWCLLTYFASIGSFLLDFELGLLGSPCSIVLWSYVSFLGSSTWVGCNSSCTICNSGFSVCN